jgi:hypothetical protein
MPNGALVVLGRKRDTSPRKGALPEVLHSAPKDAGRNAVNEGAEGLAPLSLPRRVDGFADLQRCDARAAWENASDRWPLTRELRRAHASGGGGVLFRGQDHLPTHSPSRAPPPPDRTTSLVL